MTAIRERVPAAGAFIDAVCVDELLCARALGGGSRNARSVAPRAESADVFWLC
jgi:hypothetical protein